MKQLSIISATTVGGRSGKGKTSDDKLETPFAPTGVTPEHLFALGYSACFLGAMRVAAQQTKIKVPDGSTVTAEIGIGPRSEGGFGITAALDVYLPGLPEADAHKLVETTHGICPYSNAIKASVDVTTTTHG